MRHVLVRLRFARWRQDVQKPPSFPILFRDVVVRRGREFPQALTGNQLIVVMRKVRQSEPNAVLGLQSEGPRILAEFDDAVNTNRKTRLSARETQVKLVPRFEGRHRLKKESGRRKIADRPLNELSVEVAFACEAKPMGTHVPLLRAD